MLILQNICYSHTNKDLLFENINLSINRQDKIALIGNNGVGKSTLFKIMAGILQPSSGVIICNERPYYIPQLFGQFNDYTISKALNIDFKLIALQEILNGEVNETNLTILNDDWLIEERCRDALSHWNLENLDLTQKFDTLSGGQKTKIFLAGISLHQPEIILMDEPSNHLDTESRHLLYEFIKSTASALLIVSHDRQLLNLPDKVYEMSSSGITVYSGNYDFYTEQKLNEINALNQDIKSKESELRKVKEIERDTLEKKLKLNSRGKKKQEKAGLPTILMKTLKNKAEKSTARLKDIHEEKVGNISEELYQLKKGLCDFDKMKFDFDNSTLHRGKILVNAQNINFGYEQKLLWKNSLNLLITSGERIAIKGANGSGKTTLIKIILGELIPKSGTIQSAIKKSVYIDQDYSLINNELTVYEQSQKFNTNALQEHEIKTRLNRFLFTQEFWERSCDILSGGEKMRLMLCCLNISNKAPDIIILDEPANNLDIQNIEILTSATNNYHGTLIVISHDEYFLEEIKVNKFIDLD